MTPEQKRRLLAAREAIAHAKEHYHATVSDLFAAGCTYYDIAAVLGVTHQNVYQMIARHGERTGIKVGRHRPRKSPKTGGKS